jgi:hypothetical protein
MVRAGASRGKTRTGRPDRGKVSLTSECRNGLRAPSTYGGGILNDLAALKSISSF